ncbi:MAG: TIGR04086 family membrane protein [Lachnospiraceae bacterium]|nr:TIGR04086 family membrane protein [Lachnospiraceae bacterium]
MEMKKIWKETGLAVGVSFLATLLFLLLIAFFMLKAGLTEEVVAKVMIAVYVLAPAIGGFMLGRKRKVNRFLWGILVGAVYFLLYAIAALCLQDVSVSDILWVAVPVCLGGMAGGMLS